MKLVADTFNSDVSLKKETRRGQKMRLIFLGLLILMTAAPLLAQENLVPNPSFEEHWSCPGISEIGYPYWNQTVKYWIGTFQSPDYFIDCSSNWYYQTPLNRFGFQIPKTGKAYIGEHTYFQVPIEKSTIQLSTKLLPNHNYYFSCNLSLANVSSVEPLFGNLIGIDDFGAYFSSSLDSMMTPWESIAITPQVENTAGRILDDTLNWMEVSGTFTATGDEKWMTLGSFKDSSEVQWQIVKDYGAPHFISNGSAYYYIDDVSLICLDCDTLQTATYPIFPNAFTPNNDGENDYFHCLNASHIAEMNWQVYNRWGEKIFESTDANHYWFGTYQNNPSQGETLPIGVYVWVANYRMQNSNEWKTASGNVTVVK